MRLPLDGDSVTARVLRTGRSARIDLYTEGSGTISELARRVNVIYTVGAPITVEGRHLGRDHRELGAARSRRPPTRRSAWPQFAQLLGTAIANADSRDQLTASRARVLTAGDEARRQVVRDLHDGAQQRLVETVLTLKLAQQTIARGPRAGASR